MNRRLFFLISLIVLFVPGFAQKVNREIIREQTERQLQEAAKQTQGIIILTEFGEITVELFPEQAPITVTNYLHYVDSGHYNGGSFFRTVRDDNQPDDSIRIAVIQAAGHPWKNMTESLSPIKLERTIYTGLSHRNGTISMARSEPNTATSSFFICIGNQPELDYGGHRNPDGQGFAAFGQVIEGMDVVEKIHQSNADGQALIPPILIHHITRSLKDSE